MDSPQICVAGSLNMDLIAYVGSSPAEASYSAGARFEFHIGGKSLNVAMSIAAFGAHVHLIGRVGNDIFGQEIRAAVAQAGISTAHITVDEKAQTGVGHVRVNSEGEYDTVVAGGANTNFSHHDIDSYLQSSAAPTLAVLNLEVPLDSVRYAAKRFRQAGCRVVLNLSPLQDHARSFLRLADILVLNLSEACTILNVAVDTDIRWMLAELRRESLATVVLTLGAAGLIAQEDGGDVITQTASPAAVVNSIGAGDSFLAVLVLAIGQGHSFANALRAASEGGRQACSQPESYLSSDNITIIEEWAGFSLMPLTPPNAKMRIAK
ncbi:MAG: hypothetical protein H7201_19665 [Candidatus Saccharibacteria bacterium]|nr:hypothetical protein [Microbacteriaceae bacterium]